MVVLPVEPGPVAASGIDLLQEHACRMASGCRRRLRIWSHRLDPRIYGRECFLEAVRQLAIRHPSTRVEILVFDASELARGGNRLLSLAQELPSSITIRRPAEEDEGDERSFLLADDAGYLLRPLWYHAGRVQVDYSAPAKVRRLEESFRRVWERGWEDPALRRLHL